MQSLERPLQLYSVKNAIHCDFFLEPRCGIPQRRLHQIKLVIDDRGAIMIFECENDQMRGKYYMFTPGSSLEEKDGKAQTSICTYGEAKGGLLEGENYIGTQNGLICKGLFVSGLLEGSCILTFQRHLDSEILDMRKMHFIHHKIVQTEEQHSSAANERQNARMNRLDFCKLKKSGTTDNLPKENIAHSQAIEAKEIKSADTFLHQFLNNLYEQPSKSKQSVRQEGVTAKGSFAQLNLPEREIFIGILHANESSEDRSYDNFNGFGVVVKEGWPARYGQFNNGQLNGLGRKYETQLKIEDGLFLNGILTQGFKIDGFQNKMCFGYIPSGQINIKQSFMEGNEEGFVVLIEFDSILEEEILSYRRFCHLKSLEFRNQYSSAPKGLQLRCWPQAILGHLNSPTHAFKRIVTVGHQLNNIDISMIQIAQQSSENRVEREIMAAMNNSFQGRKLTRQPKRSYFKLQQSGENSPKQSITFSNPKEIPISQFMASPKQKQEPFRDYIVEYERLTQKKQKIPQKRVVDPSFDSSPETRRVLKQIKEEDENEVNFGELIKTFQLCDSQQRQFRRKSNLARMSSAGQVDRSPVSRLQMIMEDYQDSVKQAKARKQAESAKREQKLLSSRKFRPSQVDLHAVYAEVYGRRRKE